MADTLFGRRRLGGLLATRRNKLIATGAVAVIVVGAGTGVAFAATGNDDGRYRLATAEKADVTETLALTGQVSASDSVAAAFQVSGTVGSVLVSLGDEVTAGQKLATLDQTSLKSAVTTAEDALASAKQQLEDDLDAQSSGTSSTTSSTASTSSNTGSGGSGRSGSGQSAASTGTTTTGGGAGASSTPNASAPAGSTQGGSTATGDSAALTAAKKKVTDAQQALLDQYTIATDAQTSSTQATQDAQTVCAPFLDATIDADGAITPSTGGDAASDDASSTTDTSGTSTNDSADATTDTGADGTASADDADTVTDDTATDDTSADDTSADDTTADQLAGTQSLLKDCQSSISDTLTKQQATAEAQSALQKAANALDKAVAVLTAALEVATPAPTTSASPAPSSSATAKPSASSETKTPTSANTTNASSASSASNASNASSLLSSLGTGAGSGAGAGASAKTITAEDILADRAQIEVATSDVAIAKQNLTFASLTSPIAGTVVSVALAKGDEVSAASTTAVITVQGDGGYIVTSTVPLSKIAKVASGQAASVTLPAFGKTYSGSVATIGVQNVSETSTPSYSVAVAIDPGDDALRVGATARATVTVSTSQDVLTVPTSAVTTTGSQSTVQVLKDGSPSMVSVEVGAQGSERIQITKGLEAGQQVVLADLNQAVTSDSDDSSGSSGLSGLGGSNSSRGGFSGSGFSGGGFSGGQGGPPSR